MAERCGADVTGVDLSPEAVAFCRRTHRHPRVRFEVGDAEHLPFDDHPFDIVTNVESSHSDPNLRYVLCRGLARAETGRYFLYTDPLPVQRWMEVRALLGPLHLAIQNDRHITPNVLASCDDVAATRAQAFGGQHPMTRQFPRGAGYPWSTNRCVSGAAGDRILRARRT